MTFLSNYSDRRASRWAAEAQNHTFDSLGERYGLRITPGQNSFLMPILNNISRSTAVGAIMQPGGPAWHEKLLRGLNELANVESVSSSRKGSDAKWKLDPREVLGVGDTG